VTARGGTRHACGSGEHTRLTDSVHTGTQLTMARGWRAYSDSEHEANRGGPRDGAHAADHGMMASYGCTEEERIGAGGTRGMRAHTASVHRWRARETGAGAAHVVLSARWCRSKLRLGQLLHIH
jgi:hypothetical protein